MSYQNEDIIRLSLLTPPAIQQLSIIYRGTLLKREYFSLLISVLFNAYNITFAKSFYYSYDRNLNRYKILLNCFHISHQKLHDICHIDTILLVRNDFLLAYRVIWKFSKQHLSKSNLYDIATKFAVVSADQIGMILFEFETYMLKIR